MNLLKSISHAIISMAGQVWLLATSPAASFKQALRQIEVDKHEAERLDRIRNPSKYRGK
jgi:hypothetical protein